MNAVKALPLIGLCGAFAACSDNDVRSFDEIPQQPAPSTVSFADELRDIVTSDSADTKPRSVEDKRFSFADDTAYAGLFPEE